MPTYNGPAVLVMPDGSEHDVQVKARIQLPAEDGRGDWSGEITANGGVLWGAFDAGRPLTLRALDGSEGQARVVQFGSEGGRIIGSGAPPSAWI